jgi:hypothetical protein
MKTYMISAAAAFLGSMVLAGAANADLLAAGSVGGAPSSGITRDNFDAGTASFAVTFTGDAGYVTGASASLYAPPWLSGGNGAGFGSPNQPDDADTTMYITTGTGSATFDFVGDQRYFGVLWGSIDDFNTVSFYDNGSLVKAFTGDAILAGANGDQGVNGTLYVNFTATDATVFDRVVFTSTEHAFELDNVAYGQNVPTPAPEPLTLSLFGAGLAGLGFARRRKN